MKESLIRLAKEKGFESNFLCNKPYKYSKNEDLRWLFWLTELKDWLKSYKINISIYYEFKSWTWRLNMGPLEFWNTSFKSDIDALEEACQFALDKIQDFTKSKN